MPADLDHDALAARWREGLRLLAEPGDGTRAADRVRSHVRARQRRRLIAVVGAAAIAIGAVAGGVLASGSSPASPRLRAGAPPASRPTPDQFQVRPVLATTAAPCPGDQLPGSGARAATCYSLGPVALDGYDVSSVFVETRPEDGSGIDLVVGTDAFAQLNSVAARVYGQSPPQNQLALVVAGRVVSAPRLNSRSFPTNTLRFAGLSEPDADRIVAMIGPRSPRPGASTARMRATLALWSEFPITASPRPLIIGSDILDPEQGFPDNGTKEAYLAGAFLPPAAFPSGPSSADGYPLISARDAYVALKAAGTPPASPASLTVTTITLGRASFETDRGPRTLPAWRISLRGVPNPAAVLAVSSAARFNPRGLDQFKPSEGGNVSFLYEERAVMNATGTSVTVSFVGDAPGTGPCSAEYTARVVESPTAVAITVAEVPKPPSPPGFLCRCRPSAASDSRAR